MLSSSGPGTRCPKRIRGNRAACHLHLVGADEMREEFIAMICAQYSKRDLRQLLDLSSSTMVGPLTEYERALLLDDQPQTVIDFWTRH